MKGNWTPAGTLAPPLLVVEPGSQQGGYDQVDGPDVGATDYLVKSFEFDDLLAGLRAIRRVFMAESIMIAIGTSEFYPEDRFVSSPRASLIMLTERESELLKLLAWSRRRRSRATKFREGSSPEAGALICSLASITLAIQDLDRKTVAKANITRRSTAA